MALQHALLLTILIALSSALPPATATAVEVDGWEVKLVQVVHRHGARSSTVHFNESVICRTAPCGHLNEPGKQMMLNAGRYLRERYNNGTAAVDYFPAEYNVSQIYSRSTDVLRTLQSASAVLEGLFTPSEPSDRLYAVHVADRFYHRALSDLLPSLVAQRDYQVDDLEAYLKPKVDSLFAQSEIDEMAREAYADEHCAVPARRGQCVRSLYDIAAAYRSTGEIENFPTLQLHFESLLAVEQYANSFFFVYNASDPFAAAHGSYGMPVAEELLRNMDAETRGRNEFILYHYSAHDTTLAPLAGTLGDNTMEAMMPQFGTMYIFELLEGSASDEPYVRVLRGGPGLTPDTEYVFSARPMTELRCQGTDSVVYVAEQGMCPLSDLSRYIMSTGPQDPAGLCYLSDSLKQAMACPADGSGATPNSKCLTYRIACPAQACGSGFAVDTANNMTCVSTSGGTAGMRKSAVAALCVSMVVVGVILTALVGLTVYCIRKKSVDSDFDEVHVPK